MDFTIGDIAKYRALGMLAECYANDEIFGYELYCKIKNLQEANSQIDSRDDEFVQFADIYSDWTSKEVLREINAILPILDSFTCSLLKSLSQTHFTDSRLTKEKALKSFISNQEKINLHYRARIISKYYALGSSINTGVSSLVVSETDRDETFIKIKNMSNIIFEKMLSFALQITLPISDEVISDELKSKYENKDINIFELVELSLKAEAEQKLIDSGGIRCPCCDKQDFTTTKCEYDEDGVTCSVTCDHCELSWSEFYELNSISDIDSSKKSIPIGEANHISKSMLESGACTCFECASGDLDSGQVEFDLGVALVAISCMSCESSWKENYTLASANID